LSINLWHLYFRFVYFPLVNICCNSSQTKSIIKLESLLLFTQPLVHVDRLGTVADRNNYVFIVQRLIELLDEPKDIPVFAPDGGGKSESTDRRAIDWLKGNFTQPLRIDDLATQVNMSISTFHHHFREVTAMSPLQYQKCLHLNEARRLMLAENGMRRPRRFRSAMRVPPNSAASMAVCSAPSRCATFRFCYRLPR
jgi:AraC-like DNA-binding protein